MTEREFNEVRKRRGIGIASSFGGPAIKSEINTEESVPIVEPSIGAKSLAEGILTLNYTGRPIVRFKVFRRRLLDYGAANCEKYVVDSLRYASIIAEDSERDIQFIHEGQQKVESDQEERIEVDIEYEAVDLHNPWIKRKKS